MRVLIVEDEAVIARRVARLTREILGADPPELIVAGSLEEARFALRQQPVDLLILDLNLNGADGFDLLREASAAAFQTIVVSAHAGQAMKAFELGVRDFVGKPFGKARLELALSHVLAPTARAHVAARYLGARRRGAVEFIRVEDVAYVRADGARSELVLADRTVVPHDKLLDRLEGILPAAFERIHRSYIVDLRRVARLVSREGSRYAVELKDGTTLPVGRTRVASLRERLLG